MRVLVADDSRVMRKIFRGVLEGMGYAEQDILEAADGADAIRLLEETPPPPDLVISKWDLPGLDGPALYGRLRSRIFKGQARVLFCVTKEQKGEGIPGLEGTDLIVKPFMDAAAQEKIRRLSAAVSALKAQEDVLKNVVSAADADLPFLIRLPTRLIEEFLRISNKVRHPAGAPLLAAGEVVDSLHVITSGQVELFEGTDRVVQTCMDGDCFGEFSFMLNQPSRVGARAKTPVEVASVTKAALGELVRKHPTLADYLSTLMARRWKKTGTTRITRGESDLMGNLESMPFADVIQLLNVTQKTGVLGLREGQSSGGVYFQGGEVVHAWVGDLKGEDAFYKMAAWKKARFGFNGVPRQEPHTIEQPTMTLLMEAMRRLDEVDRGGAA